MIFEKVTNITNKEEFLEKILIYIRLVEVIAKRENLSIPVITSSSPEVLKEMQDMGVIDEVKNLELLKKVLKKDYTRFLSAVAFYLSHKKLYGNQLDKLSNKKRKEFKRG